jgi:hypothetical protein
VNFSAAVSFSTEQNPVNWKGVKSRNFYLAFELLKMAIYRIVNGKIMAESGNLGCYDYWLRKFLLTKERVK